MGVLKLVNPTYGMPQEHKELVRRMKLSAGGKRKAVALLEKALEMRKNGYSKEEFEAAVKSIAREKAYKPNKGEQFLGMKHEHMVSDLEKWLLKVMSISESPGK